MLTASVDDARGQRHVAPRAQGSNRTMEAETYTMGAEGFVPLWDVNTFGAPTPPPTSRERLGRQRRGCGVHDWFVRSPEAAAPGCWC